VRRVWQSSSHRGGQEAGKKREEREKERETERTPACVPGSLLPPLLLHPSHKPIGWASHIQDRSFLLVNPFWKDTRSQKLPSVCFTNLLVLLNPVKLTITIKHHWLGEESSLLPAFCKWSCIGTQLCKFISYRLWLLLCYNGRTYHMTDRAYNIYSLVLCRKNLPVLARSDYFLCQ
jgi:hypothetical protein